MKIKYTHTAIISGIILLSGCTTYPKNYNYSPTVNVGNGSSGDVVLPSPFAKKPQPVPEQRQSFYQCAPPQYGYPQNIYMQGPPIQQVEYTHYRVPRYPDYPPYREDSSYTY